MSADNTDTERREGTQGFQAVPRGRARRFGRFARLAGGVAGNMLAHGAVQLAAGKRPRAKDLLLTPKNALKLTRQLAEMRGAAMKLTTPSLDHSRSPRWGLARRRHMTCLVEGGSSIPLTSVARCMPSP